MFYKIFHLTKFEYSEPITESVMEVRMSPRADKFQNCVQFSLDLKPAAKGAVFQDFNGNFIHFFDIPKKHTQLEIKAESLVEVFEPKVLPEKVEPSVWDEVEKLTFHEDFWEFTQPSHFSKPTARLISLIDELGLDRNADPLSVLKKINTGLFRNFEYSQAATEVDSPIDEAIKKRGGVCQDFANIMIALVRELKIPCRYVSGYLFHRTDDRSHIAQDATHAWVEAFLPQLGWVGFDPTNNLICEDRHIRVAVGRDYADVPPTRGTFKGGADSRLSVAVRVSTADSREIESQKDSFSKPAGFQNSVQRQAEIQSQQQQ
jgi:transglutaminase-like putative cysteine protease